MCELVPELGRERTRDLHPRVRRGISYSLQYRWWGVLGIALQKSVAEMVMNAGAGADLAAGRLEPTLLLSDFDLAD